MLREQNTALTESEFSDDTPAEKASTGLRVSILAPLCPKGQIKLHPRWVKPFEKAGIEIEYIPVGSDERHMEAVLERSHGLLLPGGNANVHPMFYDPQYQKDHQWEQRKHDLRDIQRDITAMKLAQKARSLNIPTLGICRGMQEMIAAFGGRLEKLEDHGIDHAAGYKKDFNASGFLEPEEIGNIVHTIDIYEGTEFSRIFKCSSLPVNSIHGEGITVRSWHSSENASLRDNFTIQAVAPDGVVEAIAYGNMIGVQSHFEVEGETPDNHRLLFAHFFGKMDSYKADLEALPVSVPAVDQAAHVS